jgi:hypothetical protein
MTARTVHKYEGHNISCYSSFKKPDPCVLCRNEMTARTVHTLDTASRDTLPLKMPDPYVFCAGMKCPPAQCTRWLQHLVLLSH